MSSTKRSEKKKRQSTKQQAVDGALSKVKAAYEMGDFMTFLPAFKIFNRNGLELTVAFYSANQLPKEDMEWAFTLLKSNMEALYITAGWGWNDKKKRKQLCHESSLYDNDVILIGLFEDLYATPKWAVSFLVARDAQKPIGYINFRFELEEDVEVVYCYEIQLDSSVRRKGVGKFLLQILELIGHKSNMRKVMLTVFKDNIPSLDFFRKKMGYIEDETSPCVCDPENADTYTYVILSKSLVKPKAMDQSFSPPTSYARPQCAQLC